MIDVGQTVGNYRVTAKLGEGGMGIVFLAEHPVIGRKAALKAIHPEHLRNAEVLARFVNEAKSINQIGHDHIVEVTDFGKTPDGDFYFIMEYLQGVSLAETILREAPLPPARALAIAAQIADALDASHEHGVVHRDLKPENVFLVTRAGARDFVKVLDFGLAKLLHGDGAAHETRAGIIMGTPCYMAPEQCQGRLEVDHRADVYALGVLLFEMLTGKLPFGGDGYNDVLVKQITMRAPDARSIVASLPESLDIILHRALAKTPAERFDNMRAFRAALLDPDSSARGEAPPVARRDDLSLSRRMHAARPMRRAEMTLQRTIPAPIRTTFDEGTGELHLDDDDDDLVPARSPARAIAITGVAALAGMALAAGLTYTSTSYETALAAASTPVRMVPVTFSSDPDGATVLAADGTPLGTTPLSIEIAAQDAPVEYQFRKDGFRAKSIVVIPNVPSPLFAVMQAEAVPETKEVVAVEPEPALLAPPRRPPRAARAPSHRARASAQAVIPNAIAPAPSVPAVIVPHAYIPPPVVPPAALPPPVVPPPAVPTAAVVPPPVAPAIAPPPVVPADVDTDAPLSPSPTFSR